MQNFVMFSDGLKLNDKHSDQMTHATLVLLCMKI